MSYYSVWPEWVAQTNASITTCTCSDPAWAIWAGTNADTAATTGDYTLLTWMHWANAATATTGSVVYTHPSAEAIAAQRQRMDEARRQQEEWAIKRAEARAAAKKLLEMLLNAQQKEQLEKHRYFEIVSQKGRRYRINEGIAGNVRLISKSGQAIVQLCIHPASVPEEDAMLAQKLMLETDEDAFLRTANLTNLTKQMTEEEAEEIMREAGRLKGLVAA